MSNTYRVDHPEGIYIDQNGKHLHRSMFNLDWIEQAGIKPKVIWDVGCWDGGDAVRFKQRFPESKVYAFELLKRNYEIYSQYARGVGVIMYNTAISNVSGQWIEFWEASHATGDNAQSTLNAPCQRYLDNYGSYVKHNKASNKVWVETVSKFCYLYGLNSIDVLHMDVESGEHQVIEGFGKIRPKMIFAEFLLENGWTNQKPFSETFGLLKSMGYTMIENDLPFDKLFIYDP